MICKNCNSNIADDSLFCPKCGVPQNEENNRQDARGDNAYYYNQNQGAGQPTSNAVFAFAYVPFLFWLPLAFDKNKTEIGRKSANQGLLLLIVNCVSHVVFSFIQSIIASVTSFSIFMNFSANTPLWFIVSMISWAVYGFIYVTAIIGVVKGLKDEYFEIPVIGSIRIIK